MAYSKKGMGGVLSDYTHLRTIPALASVVFVVAGLYQFGGISSVDLTWLNYTLTTEHATLVSLGVLVLAFMSSETKDFASYDGTERMLIAAAPVIILGYQYVPFVTDLINTTSNLGPMVAFLLTLVSWAVAVR
ncbi:hypothetical protein ACOJIV_22735 [Haloarcula sp. AONF1]